MSSRAITLRHEIADHEAKEGIVQASALDWTIVRAPKLTDGEHTGNYRDGRDISTQAFFPTLSRADVAEFMLRQLESSAWLRSVVRLLPMVSA